MPATSPPDEPPPASTEPTGPPPRRRYARIRRYLAPAALVGAVLLLGRDQCGGDRAVDATVALDFGAAAPDVRDLSADLYQGTDKPLATFSQQFPDGATAPATFRIAARPGVATLHLVIATTHGPYQLERPIEVVDSARISVSLEAALTPTP